MDGQTDKEREKHIILTKHRYISSCFYLSCNIGNNTHISVVMDMLGSCNDEIRSID